MKLLLDTCVWGAARQLLKAMGHDVIWTGEWPQDPGDEEILNIAIHEERVLVTLDKDFGELAILHTIKHCGIVRLVNISATHQATVCNQVLMLHGDELQRGAIVTAETGRLRVRPPDY
jgi:predicted nuclease of predicted toxin-antitoxin system